MTANWGKHVSHFLEKFGDANPSEALTDEQIAPYIGILPKILLDLWRVQGWGCYAEGIFWTVNPADYHEVLQQWLLGTPHENEPGNYVIARTAFGTLYVWNSTKGDNFKISSPYHWLVPSSEGKIKQLDELERDMELFLSIKNPKRLDEDDESGKPLFKRTLKKLGPLESDEMYGFVPAVSLGGKMLLKNLQKVDIVVHLAMLAELQPTEMFNYNNYR